MFSCVIECPHNFTPPSSSSRSTACVPHLTVIFCTTCTAECKMKLLWHCIPGHPLLFYIVAIHSSAKRPGHQHRYWKNFSCPRATNDHNDVLVVLVVVVGKGRGRAVWRKRKVVKPAEKFRVRSCPPTISRNFGKNIGWPVCWSASRILPVAERSRTTTPRIQGGRASRWQNHPRSASTAATWAPRRRRARRLRRTRLLLPNPGISKSPRSFRRKPHHRL